MCAVLSHRAAPPLWTTWGSELTSGSAGQTCLLKAYSSKSTSPLPCHQLGTTTKWQSQSAGGVFSFFLLVYMHCKNDRFHHDIFIHTHHLGYICWHTGDLQLLAHAGSWKSAVGSSGGRWWLISVDRLPTLHPGSLHVVSSASSPRAAQAWGPEVGSPAPMATGSGAYSDRIPSSLPSLPVFTLPLSLSPSRPPFCSHISSFRVWISWI